MNGWNRSEYLNTQIEKIEELKRKGHTVREILDTNEFCFEALKSCNLPVSYLVPKIEAQAMNPQEWDTHTSSEHKWEFYNDVPFGDPGERDRVFMGLLYSMGFKHLLEILEQESRVELLKLLSPLQD